MKNQNEAGQDTNTMNTKKWYRIEVRVLACGQYWPWRTWRKYKRRMNSEKAFQKVKGKPNGIVEYRLLHPSETSNIEAI
jgi:hypothetical protein